MKRIINILLCLAIAISSCSMVILADETAGMPVETAVVNAPAEAELVTSLGIMSVPNKADFWTTCVTRGEFAQYVYNIVKSMDIQAKETYYRDVESGSKLDIALNYLVKAGVLSVGESRLYRPDDYITFSEAYKMLVVITGYEPYAQATGGYPIGYLDAARHLNISTGVVHADFVDNASAVKLIYNTLFVKMYDLVSVTPIGNQYTGENTERVIERYFDIYRVDGIITKKNMTSLNSKGKVKKGIMEINGVVYNDLIEDEQLLGYRVRALVKDNEYGNDDVIFADISDKTVVVEIDADNLDSITTNKITYRDENEKTKILTLKGALFVKNGTLVGTDVPSKMKIKKGKMLVISNDEGVTYDTVIATEYEIFVVGLLESTYRRIFDKYDPKKVVNLDDRKLDSVEILLNGEIANFLHIEDGDVLSVVRSEDGNIVTAVISNDIVAGTIEGISGSNMEYLTVDGVEYVLNSDLAKRRKASFGDKVELVFDVTGKVAEIRSADSDAYQTGFVHKIAVLRGGLTRAYGMEVYTTAGENKILELQNELKVYVGRETVKMSPTDVVGLLSKEDDQNALRPQLIRFSVNSKGIVNGIVVPEDVEEYEEEDEDLSEEYVVDLDMRDSRYLKRILKESKNTFYRSIILPKTPICENTLIIQVPDETTLEKDADYRNYFKILDLKSIQTNRKYIFEAYKLNNDTPYADVLLFKCGSGYELTSYDPYAMVREVSVVIDGYGNQVYGLEVFQKTKGVQYITSPECVWPEEGVEEGDIVKFAIDGAGRIGAIAVQHRSSAAVEPGMTPIKGSLAGAEYVTCHYAIEKYEGEEMDAGGIKSLISLGEKKSKKIDYCLVVSRIKQAPVYDRQRRPGERVYLGTIDNIITYKGTGGAEASLIISTASLGSVENLFIIN